MKRWKPKDFKDYYYIDFLTYIGFRVLRETWLSCESDTYNFRIGNCFKTKKEAETKLKAIKKLLKEK